MAVSLSEPCDVIRVPLRVVCVKLKKYRHGFPRSAQETKCGQTDRQPERRHKPPPQLRRAGDKCIFWVFLSKARKEYKICDFHFLFSRYIGQNKDTVSVNQVTYNVFKKCGLIDEKNSLFIASFYLILKCHITNLKWLNFLHLGVHPAASCG